MSSKSPSISTKSPTIRRILREAAELSQTPSADYIAEPLEQDLFEWHFTLRGPPKSVYSEGQYHGKIILPPTYPLRPPTFKFITPNGRFEANREICLSISGHHEETWQPAWGIRTAIVALRSFMETNARGQLGGLETSEDTRREFARKSSSWKCPACAKTNGEIMKQCEDRAKEASEKEIEVTVPDELSLVWKDETTATKEPSVGVSSEPVHSRNDITIPPTETVPSLSEQNRITGTALRSPTYQQTSSGGSIGLANQGNVTAIPVWIDRFIVVLAVLLLALLIKVMFGL